VVRHYLAQKWSPQQIAARLGRSGELAMSHESIYQFIRGDRRAGGNLFRHCRILPKKGRRLRGKPERRGIQAGKRHISERPASVELRLRTGHWEGDTVIGKDKRHCLLTLVERKTGYAVIKKIKARNSEQAITATLSALKEHGKKMKTLTFDNGTEFHDYKLLEQAYPVKCYFATPYHSWERGSNENLNGLIRQYLPKGSCFSSVDQAQCNWIAHQLNTRPRKRLGYLTPEECYERP
jgi:IS30 family transposase